ncbi:hypothetical protein [Marinomonas flavescens]|uniref:hypothetical protein n=1 Tax=Marinomonas flavescens TaxID=2529379 RepID=UPI001A9D034C|nr:hypothetical protein [Marinomonas flavescens]
MHLSVSATNFGIREYTPMNDALREVFFGCPEIEKSYAYLNNKLGIGIDETKAKRYPVEGGIPSWTMARTPDGTSSKP